MLLNGAGCCYAGGTLGAPKAALILQRALGGFVESYAFIHEELAAPRYGEVRVQLQDLLVERSAAIARHEKFDSSEVRSLFMNCSPMMRVLVLGLMEGDPSLADSTTIAAAIADSRSGNEQFHGLKLAQQCWRGLPKSGRQAVRAAVSGAEIPPDSDRRLLAEAVLALPLS